MTWPELYVHVDMNMFIFIGGLVVDFSDTTIRRVFSS